MRIVTLFDAVSKTLERAGLVWMFAVDKESWFVALQAESKVDVVAVAIGHVLQAEFIEFGVEFWIGVLKEMLFALENAQS